MSKIDMEDKTVRDTLNKMIEDSDLNPDVRQWLASEIDYFSMIIGRYTEQPQMIEISEESSPEVRAMREDLRKNPYKIIETIIHSADQLYAFQQAYNGMIVNIAREVGIENPESYTPNDLALEIQKATLSKYSTECKDHLENGGRLAFAMLGVGGVGKGTVIKASGLPRAVNTTTREQRPGEVPGKDYDYIKGIVNIEGDTADGKNLYLYDEEGNPRQFLADLIRAGRGRYGTTVQAFEKAFESSRVILVEQSPDQVLEIGRKVKDLMPDVKVLPVCVMPPYSGLLEIAVRVVVRTYGDPTHDDNASKGYKIKDAYLESTLGSAQMAEVEGTTSFFTSDPKMGVVYIVNDKLDKTVEDLKSIYS